MAEQKNCQLWAHSPNKDGMAQLYLEHIQNVKRLAEQNALNTRCLLPVASVGAAATVHDAGKLAPENQRILSGEEQASKLPVPHEDVGSLWMLQGGDELAAMLVYAHHRGLPSIPVERTKPFTDAAVGMFRDSRVAARADKELPTYAQRHRELGLELSIEPSKVQDYRGLATRISLSCLVDADHSDTAAHYGKPRAIGNMDRRWSERLAALDNYARMLSKRNAISPRTTNRCRLYAECGSAPLEVLATLSAPVGAGKTLASMAYCLRQAIAHEMRHVFIVLPFTAIIDQSVHVLREALTLPTENGENVVAAVHHKAEYESYTARALASQWDSPIIVTTSVQFFEILASCRPGALRRMHELPGSMIYIDEVHGALPSHLWRVTWDWMQELARNWNCCWLLGSGSLPELWAVPGLVDHGRNHVPNIVSAELSRDLQEQEGHRIALKVDDAPFDLNGVGAFILSKPGPRLVVLNTVKNAAVLARDLQHRGVDTLHLSTALTPNDRARIIQRILDRLNSEQDNEWVLVATSCIEAGMDFSFRTGFRESASLNSLVQTGGRVNRNSLWEASEVWSIRLEANHFSNNPAFLTSRQVLAACLDEQPVWAELPEMSTDALRREFSVQPGTAATASALVKSEKSMEYPTVATNYKVVEDQRSTVVVNQEIAARIRSGEPVRWQQLQMHSVQLRDKLVLSLKLQPLGHSGIYDWEARKYEPDLLGYMAELV